MASNLSLAGFAIGSKTNLSSDLIDSVIVFDTDKKQISLRGVDFLPQQQCVAQFGVYWDSGWKLKKVSDAEITAFGDISDLQILNSGSDLAIQGNIFYDVKPSDVEFHPVGFDNLSPSTDVKVVPYGIDANALWCGVFKNGTISDFTGFKVKVYK